MVDAIGDGWEGAQIAVIENGVSDGSQPIFKDSLASNEKARGESLCLSVDTCYRIVVDGGMWMNEIRWGIGHSTAKTENTTTFMARNAELIESKATWLAPANCSFSLYGACSNSCKSGYGENPPTLDDDGNIIEKPKGSGQGNSSGGQTKVTNSTALGAIEEQSLASAAPISSPSITSAPVSANPESGFVPDNDPLPTSQPTASRPIPSPISSSPTSSPLGPSQTIPGSFLSAGAQEIYDDASVGEPLSWSYYSSYSYSSYSYNSYERKARRERERRIRQKRRLGRQK